MSLEIQYGLYEKETNKTLETKQFVFLKTEEIFESKCKKNVQKSGIYLCHGL